MKQLENFRYNELGSSYLALKTKPKQKIYLSYEHHVTKAFYYCINDISDLENSTQLSISNGAQTHSSISFWFLALEAYVNTLIKVCCVKKNLDFSDFKKQDLSLRLSTLIDLLELDKREFNQNGIFTKVNEFCQFRNELFHDRHFGDRIKFKRTNFSEVPFLSNQIDTFQSLLILLEITNSLRFAIDGLDTMPNAIIKNHEFAVWEKLDICYNCILRPCLEAALNKHTLSTQLNLSLPTLIQQKSKLFQKSELVCLLTAEQENNFFVEVDETPTRFCKEIYQQFLKQYDYEPDTFRIAKIIID